MLRLTLLTWLLTCFLGSLLLGIALGVIAPSSDRELALLIPVFALGIGLVLSLPALLLYSLLVRHMVTGLARHTAKLAASAFALIAPVLTGGIVLAIMGERPDSELLGFVLPYSAAFLLAVWIIRWPAPAAAGDEVATTGPAGGLSVPFPAAAFYTAIVLSGAVLLYDIYTGFTGLFARQLRVQSGLHMARLAVMIAGVIAFALRRTAGWYLLAFTSATAVTGALLALALNVVRYHMPIESAIRFAAYTLCFAAMHIVCIVQLSQAGLKLHYHVTSTKAGLALGLGLAYGLINLVLIRYFIA